MDRRKIKKKLTYLCYQGCRLLQ